MLIGALLVLTWLILLVRYPAKALPVSLAALFGLALVAVWVFWLDQREERQLAHLELRLNYAPGECPADRPLALNLKNGSDKPLLELRWKVSAYAPGDSVNLVQSFYDSPRYRGPGELLPGESWQDCLPLPPLRPGYRAATVEFRAERLQGSFAD
ncbi:multidrug transporter [Pseudomonas cavernicola]|uniref:Multidrug transporter n=1 Tax=Pseudomonas cavernicola TaxID=2320866 RepID=A0A418XD25_9PSED|nr:multidrug transporter [Pseudomonas cavernicola]RJG10347.1 multidrug transporter [Pseudomonas cavernicola]